MYKKAGETYTEERALISIGLATNVWAPVDKAATLAANGFVWEEEATPAVSADKIWQSIKAKRDHQKDGGVTVGDKWFHSDADSRIQWLGLVILGQNVPPIQWKTMDGTFVTMTPTLAGAVFQALVIGDSSDFANAETHRLAMFASPTPESYDYSTGWRPVFA